MLPRQTALLTVILAIGTLVGGAAAHGDAGASCSRSDSEAAAAGLDLDVCWTPHRCFAPQTYPCALQTGAALLRIRRSCFTDSLLVLLLLTSELLCRGGDCARRLYDALRRGGVGPV